MKAWATAAEMLETSWRKEALEENTGTVETYMKKFLAFNNYGNPDVMQEFNKYKTDNEKS